MITKTGQLNDCSVEPFLTLPDGSKWQLLMFHYVDNGNNLFTQENATDCSEHGLYSRLKWVNQFTYGDKYEFYVIQDDVKHRWTQTSQPTANSIAGFTVISGDPVNGLAKASQSNSYLGYDQWWGACGCWTKYTSGGKSGIPGFGTHGTGAAGIAENYIALYARIDTPKAFIENNDIASGSIIYEY